MSRRKPSEVQLQALSFIEANPQGFTCTRFANHLWDTRSWQAHTIGKTGGSYLWRLENMGLIEPSSEGYRLTSEGTKRLRAAGRHPMPAKSS